MTQIQMPFQRRIPWRIVLPAVALSMIVIAIWWFVGRKMWTDDQGLRVADGEARLREVLWNKPRPLGDWFDDDQQHYEPSLSPDGTELYFVSGKPGKNADIYVSYRRNNEWSKPEPVKAINTPYDELGPRVTADGKFLLFYSDRPGGFGGYDIWASARGKNGWGKPFNLGPGVNSEFNEFTPDPTPDGKHLIFATNRVAAKKLQTQAWRATIRENEAADYDLWIAELKEPDAASPPAISTPTPSPGTPGEGRGEGPAQPVAKDGPHLNPLLDYRESRPAAPTTLPATRPTTAPSEVVAIPPQLDFSPAHEIPGINTPSVEGASCMSPAGDFLYFASNRPGGFGKFDIWRCRVSADWKCGPVENAGAEINSADNETDPTLAFNGYRLVFSSDRGSDNGTYRLYSSDSREVYAMRQGRPLPQLGRSFWLFLTSLLILIPLLLFLRGWDDRRLNVLQKCLALSALFHLLLILGLSFLFVSQTAYHYVRQQLGVEVAINLNAGPEAEIGTLVRRQSTGTDLPTVGAPLRAEKITKTPLETVMARGPVDVALPRAAMMDDRPAPQADLVRLAPTVKTDAVALQPVAPHTDAPHDPLDIHFNAQRISQIETKPQVESATATVSKAATELPAMAEKIAAPSVAVAQAKPSQLPIDPGPAATPKLPAGGATDQPRVAPAVPPSATEAPKVDITNSPVEKVATADAAIPSVAGPKNTVAAPLQAPSAAPAVKSDVTPTAGPVRSDAVVSAIPSIATAGAFHPAAGPVVPDAAAPGSANLVAAPEAIAPKATANVLPVASGQPSAPKIQETSAGTERQGNAVAVAPATGVDVPAPKASSAMAASSVAAPSPELTPHAVKAIVAGPSTLPSQSIASAIGSAPTAPELNLRGPTASGPHITDNHATTPELQSGSAGAISGPIASTNSAPSGGHAHIDTGTTPTQAQPGSAIAANLTPVNRIGVPAVVGPEIAAPAVTIPGAMEGPQIAMPHAAPGLPSQHPTPAGAGDKAPEATGVVMSSKQSLHGAEGGGTKNVAVDIPGPVLATAKLPHEAGTGLDPISARPHITPAMQSAAPDVSIGPLPSDIGGGKLNAPDSPFALRAPEMHRPIIEKLGGTKQSEDAVAKALFWLSNNQEDDGRWTAVVDARGSRKRGKNSHDTAITGLTLLAFLAQDHRPDKPGPYRETVTKALQYLLDEQRRDGDLRGEMAGPGANQGNMYDHGMASYAMAEAALLTHDPRYTDAAMRAAKFIVDAQNIGDGGWRYAPREAGDSSVFGWQIMALHSAERLGFQIPAHTHAGIDHYISIATSGRYGMLAGYQPHREATPTMTAQMVFSRMLLGKQFTDDEMAEASDFLSRTEVSAARPDLYYWYYASLCMSQMQTPAWKSWNQKTRDALIAMQHPEGEHGGYWQAQVYKGQYNDRVLATAMGALTLEVYYRYMPMQAGNAEKKDKNPQETK